MVGNDNELAAKLRYISENAKRFQTMAILCVDEEYNTRLQFCILFTEPLVFSITE